ncbi:FKBP-type peptidyl-prolyl cis-trans isomerase [Archangium lansingense]|uniref:Peptidyl-prolyl cis-trans isomerase n=1 Tax=Archangium lansingense TaxID=2995310 RepID=A0ABT4A3K0_9BACT|nr:peptidylprolyl isomerase [Archangium lansinium]MCY1076178.1 peptidylprolyl isomerase [Archangium lansinium]
MKVSKDSVVSLEYRLHLGDGQVVDESEPGKPLAYMHGHGQIVPGLEGQLEGMSAGESKKVVVPPSQGYGEHDPRGLQEVPREMFPPNANLQAGMTISAQTADGDVIPITIRELKGEKVVVDLNHPMAGKTLHFDITVREVRAATDEEKEHGHAHGPGGAH